MTDTKVGILGAETLLGKEVREVVESRGSVGKVRAFSAVGEQSPEEQDGEAVTSETISAAELRDIVAVLLTGSAEAASQAYDLARGTQPRLALIDCLGQLESRPEACIVAPLLHEPQVQSDWLFVVAHPVASALALIVSRLEKYRKVTRVIANVFEPASERGKPGVSELHQQTTALLTFKTLNKTVFDSQVSFNLLPRVGEDSARQLLTAEARIAKHLALLLGQTGASLPIPSVRVVQAPVFHGYSISAWVEFEAEVQPQGIEETLASAQIEIRRQEEEAPDNVGAASQSGLIAGDIRVDRNHPRAAWIWIVMDNLRVVADAAADIARNLRPQPSPPVARQRKS